MYISSTPSMVTADVTPLVEANVLDLIDLLASDEFFADFVEATAAKPTGAHDGHAPERLAVEKLVAALVARLSTRVALTGMQAVRVAEQMQALGRARTVPTQRKGEAA
jgi:hypothetical protein